MANRVLSLLLTAHSGSLRTELARAATSVDHFGKKVSGAHRGAAASSSLMQMAIKGGAVAIAASLVYAGAQAAQFETRMRNVNSISKLSEAGFRDLGKSVLDLSRAVPQSANNLAEGLYQIASSGFQGAEGLTVLRAAAVAASAGLATTSDAATAISAVINAYGLQARDATDVSDALFQTVNLGVVNFSELTGVIGDVVGTAAAATVPIGDVGAAIATMTLSGISAAEAGTSLNRVLQSLLQPSDSLAALYKQLGYQSGSAALKTKGLHGVMEDLRKATGGNVDALLTLFPEIRAMRGAFGLMANDGANYAKTTDGVADATKRAGATQAAFNEQMKSASAQWHIFKNKVDAAAISLGTKGLPVLIGVMRTMTTLAQDVGPGLNHALAAMAPLMRNLGEVGVNLWKVMLAIATAGGPAAKAIVGLAAGAALGTLNALASVLATVTGLVANNEAAFGALAAVLTAALLPSLIATMSALGGAVFAGAARAIFGISNSAFAASEALRAMGTASIVATGGLALLVGVAAGLFMHLRNEAKKGRADIDAMFAGALKSSNLTEITNGLHGMTLEYQRQRDILAESSKLGLNPLRNWSLTFKAEKAQGAMNELNKGSKELEDRAAHIHFNLNEIARVTGKSYAQASGFATAAGVDLTNAFADSGTARDKVISSIKAMETQTGTSTAVMAAFVGTDIAAVEALAKSIQDAMAKSNEAFSSATDVIGNYKPVSAADQAEGMKTATERLADAQQNLKDIEDRQGESRTKNTKSHAAAVAAAEKRVAEARRPRRNASGVQEDPAKTAERVRKAEEKLRAARSKGGGPGASVGDEIALRKARDQVAEATKGVTEAQGKVHGSSHQLKMFYADQITSAEGFVEDINEATRRGLDPKMIARLLQEGPEAAAPVLQAILADHSGGMITLVNDAETKLGKISERVVEFARLTTLAVKDETDTRGRDLSTAMAISSQNMAQGASASVQSIAAAIGKPTSEVRRVMLEYGITLVNEVQAGIDSRPLTLTPLFPKTSGAGTFYDEVKPPTYNPLPSSGSAGAGYQASVGPASRRGVTGTGAHPAITNNTTTTTTNQTTLTGDIHATDVNDVLRQAEQRKRLAGLSGASAGGS